jgi:predicted Rossmann fold nucleotide-binding protein DprA/Smf involved in DNA uptake
MEEFNLSISKPQSVEAVSPGENISDQRLNQVISQKQYDLSSLGLLNDESILLGLISHQPILLDDLVDKTNLNISIISDILLRLQMKRLIRQLPGKQFIRN